MAITCPSCSQNNSHKARYCEACGTAIHASGSRRSGNQLLIRVGRHPENDLVIDYPTVSGYQAVLSLSPEKLTVQDMKSTNGTFLNTPDNRISKAVVRLQDLLYFGSYPIKVKRIMRSKSPLLPRRKEFVTLKSEVLMVGSDPGCDIILNHQDIAARHFRCIRTQDGMLLEDLGSPVGTKINDLEVREPTILHTGDLVVVGTWEFLVEGRRLVQQQSGSAFLLAVQGVSSILNEEEPDKRKVLLDHISLSLYPGELCGLMGLAGAGKTTLLRTANGCLPPSLGCVTINGLDLYEHFDRFRHAIGYVPQEDIFHKDLTVEQALGYAARLRLASAKNPARVDALIDSTLQRLRLFDANPQIRETRIGQISGGQKRRLNMAIELLADPAIFFLDEPTSGLSSEDALIVMELLRTMADSGKTILLSLHQPSMQIYSLMDNVIYLHRGGKLAYYGPSIPDSILFCRPDLSPAEVSSPDVVLKALETESPSWWKDKYRQSTYYRELVADRRKHGAKLGRANSEPSYTPVTALRQWRVFHGRTFRVKLQDRMNAVILLLQAPIIAALIALVFHSGSELTDYQNTPTILYLMVISAVWFGCSNSARDICGEWSVYLRERMFNLKIVPYLGAKLTVGLLVCLLQCGVLTWIVSGACRLRAPPESLLLTLWSASLCGVAIGLLVSAFASPFKKNNEIAVGLIPIILLPMVILGGVIKPVKEMSSATRVLAGITPTRWAFETAMLLEARGSGNEEVTIETPFGQERKLKKDLLLDPFFDRDKLTSVQKPMTAPIWIGLTCMLLTIAALRRQDLH